MYYSFKKETYFTHYLVLKVICALWVFFSMCVLYVRYLQQVSHNCDVIADASIKEICVLCVEEFCCCKKLIVDDINVLFLSERCKVRIITYRCLSKGLMMVFSVQRHDVLTRCYTSHDMIFATTNKSHSSNGLGSYLDQKYYFVNYDTLHYSLLWKVRVTVIYY